MAKKKAPETPAPVVSSIPLPPSDSPLVIDLPDGQKLVVGKMENGTVIEVATWRGTGRPDSRTSRLMLGVSNADALEESEVKKEERTESVEVSKLESVVKLIKSNLMKLLLPLASKISVLRNPKRKNEVRKGNSGEKLESAKANKGQEGGSSIAEIDSDIEKFLESLKSDPFGGGSKVRDSKPPRSNSNRKVGKSKEKSNTQTRKSKNRR